jgi:hypothetical protein
MTLLHYNKIQGTGAQGYKKSITELIGLFFNQAIYHSIFKAV